jgi:predicted 2-oxoglutarate/Fe(II)-dependent dioxygenase YbiX
VKTNISKQKDFLDNETMDKIVTENLLKMISETNCFPRKKPTETLITQYWFNVYEKGDFQEMHQHNNVPEVTNGKRYDDIFSMIYILHDEESSPVIFRMDDIEIPFYPMKHTVDFNTSMVDEIKEGTILIFSSHLKHTVIPVKQSGRTTIAFNVMCSFE